jgi:hypothetical protein
MLLYHTVFKGVIMVIDNTKCETLVNMLLPRWERRFSFVQIGRFVADEKNQRAAERGMNVFGWSEEEAWNKVMSMMLHKSM